MRVAFVTWREDVEGGFDVGHWWGGRDGKYDSVEGDGRGGTYISRGGWGIEDILSRSLTSFMWVTAVKKIEFSGKEIDKQQSASSVLIRPSPSSPSSPAFQFLPAHLQFKTNSDSNSQILPLLSCSQTHLHPPLNLHPRPLTLSNNL